MVQTVKANIKGIVELVIIRNNKVVERSEIPNNAYFNNAAATAVTGGTSTVPSKINMVNGSISYDLAMSASYPSYTGGTVTFKASSNSVPTYGLSTWSLKLQDGANNVWAATNISITGQVYPNDTLEITWNHSVTGLTAIGNAGVAQFIATGTGAGVNTIGICSGVNATTGAISHNVAATTGVKSTNASIAIIQGSYPNAGGDAFPSSNNSVGYIAVGSSAWATFGISTGNQSGAAGRRAALTFNLDF